MVQHIAGVTATSNSSANTQDLFLEITSPTAGTVKVKRVRCGFGSGAQSAGVDNNFLIWLYRYNTTTAGSPTALNFSPGGTFTLGSAGNNPVSAGGVAGSIWTARNANTAVTVPAGMAVKVKNGTTGLVIGTTNVQIVDEISPNGRALYEWLARDDDDMIVTQPADCFGIALSSNVASQVFTITCDFIV